MQLAWYWKHWLHTKSILIGAIFGLFGLLTLWADMRIPIMPSLNIAADAREFFVVLGAWFGGPIGGLLAGSISAFYSPIGDAMLHFSTWIAHTLAGFALGMVYLPKYKNLGWLKFSLLWASCILIYYATLLGVVSISITLLKPEFIHQLAGVGQPLIKGYLTLFLGAFPEAMYIFFFSLITLLALPQHYRNPAAVDKPLNP